MGFSVPVFPLAVDIYTGPWLTRSLRVSTTGNLAVGRRVYQFPQGSVPQVEDLPNAVTLLLPKLTDVRDYSCAGHVTDLIECPSGSGRWYGVLTVDDVAKGFSNEHRYVLMGKIYEFLNGTAFAGLNWPTPIP